MNNRYGEFVVTPVIMMGIESVIIDSDTVQAFAGISCRSQRQSATASSRVSLRPEL
jgi:hypothetical protein